MEAGPRRGGVGIPVEIAGLDTLIPEIGKGRIVLVESGTDPAKSFFIRRLSISALRVDMAVTFITSRDREEVLNQLAREGGPTLREGKYQESLEVIERDRIDSAKDLAGNGGLLVVDSFSLLTMDLSPPQVASLLRHLRSRCLSEGTTVLLGTDRGMADPRVEAATTLLTDGLVQFHAREAPEGVLRFLRIPKWDDGKFVDRNVHYDFDGHRMAIDLRRRVL